ncbi:MAG: hypothetical protein IPG47_17470 [Thermoflexaceae bacterium]|nr:hypothetical protein [Thermoflexaceae bacterium]
MANWIKSYQDLGRHPKTSRLARTLGISRPAAIGHLHLLWWWALDYAKDGDLGIYDAGEVADACLWDQDAEAFVEALVTAGWLDADPSGEHWRIHSWEEHGGKLQAERVRNNDAAAGRMRRRRSEQTANEGEGSPVTVSEHGRNRGLVTPEHGENAAEMAGSPFVTPEHGANDGASYGVTAGEHTANTGQRYAPVTPLEKSRSDQIRSEERREEQQQRRSRGAREAAAAAAASATETFGEGDRLAPLTARMATALSAAGIGIDPFTADVIDDYAQEHGETGAADFERACAEAAMNNARKFSYVRSVIERCAADRAAGLDPWAGEAEPAPLDDYEARRATYLGGPPGHLARNGLSAGNAANEPLPLFETSELAALNDRWSAAVEAAQLADLNRVPLRACRVLGANGHELVVEAAVGTSAAGLQRLGITLGRALSVDAFEDWRVRFVDPPPAGSGPGLTLVQGGR